MFGLDDMAAATAGATLLGGFMTNQANQDIAASNNAWSAGQYATRYQTQVKDLEAAGLNPMLAVTQGAPPAPQAQPVTLQNPFHSAAQTYNDTVSSSGGYQRDVASAGLSSSSAKLNDEQVKMVQATTDKVREEIKNIPIEGKRLYEAAKSLYEQSQLISSQEVSQRVQTQVLRETVANLKKDGTLKQLDIDAAKSLENLGRTSKELAPIAQLLLSVLRVSK